MDSFGNPTFYLAVGSAVTWMWGRLRNRFRASVNQEIVNNFVEEMAHNHLPHIYSGLRVIAGALDVKIPEPPPIEFTQLNGRKK